MWLRHTAGSCRRKTLRVRGGAVAWNGLTYPILSDTGQADLSADVEAILKADAEMSARRRDSGYPMSRSQDAITEGEGVDFRGLLPIKACLLLRLGQATLANRMFDAWFGSAPRAYQCDWS